MVEHSPSVLDKTFQALANPTRRAILATLSQREAAVVEIAEHFDMSLNGVSKHLKVLEQAGLIKRDIQGRTHYCSLNPLPLRQAESWLEYYRPYWEKRLDALETFLENQQKEENA